MVKGWWLLAICCDLVVFVAGVTGVCVVRLHDLLLYGLTGVWDYGWI